MHSGNRSSGFTLIELLIVIAIIGILAAVMIPSLLGIRHKGNDTAALVTARNIVNSMAALEAGNTAGADVDSCTLSGSDVAFTMNPASTIANIIARNVAKNITAITCTSDATQYRVQVAYFGGSNSSLDFKSAK